MDINVNLPTGEAGELFLQLLDLGTLFANDNPGTSRMDIDFSLIRRPFDLDLGNPCVKESTLDKLLYLEVLME